MGFYVALASAAVSAYQGYSANAEAKRANAASEAASKKDYEDRLRRASEGANILIEQYNKVREERPSTSWNDFVLGFVNSIDDPTLRRAYTEAKRTDFQGLTEFATVGTETNSENVLAAFDKFTGGRGQEILDTRTDLVLQDTAADQFKRAYELRAPISTNAGSVKFDDKGNLIEGQRSDKQTFQIAQEVDQQARQQQIANISSLEQDRMSAAERQKQTATDYLQFYDPTGLSIGVEQDRQKYLNQYQFQDEQNAFSLYSAFAQASAGITPTQPTYRDPTAGNKYYADAAKTLASAYGSYASAG